MPNKTNLQNTLTDLEFNDEKCVVPLTKMYSTVPY